MATHRRYTAKQRAAAVGIATLGSVTAAAEKTGIPATTIDYWMDKPEFVKLRDKTRDQVADEMWAAIQVGVREVAKGLSGDAPLRDKSVALGILYDKHALMVGLATSRSESRDLTGTMPDADLDAAIREANAIATDSGGTSEAEGPPEGEGLRPLPD